MIDINKYLSKAGRDKISGKTVAIDEFTYSGPKIRVIYIADNPQILELYKKEFVKEPESEFSFKSEL